MRVLGVIPNDPLDDYERGGIGSWLPGYYNPQGFFERVYCLSPLERRREKRYGMTVVPTRAGRLTARVRQLGLDVLRAYGGSWPADFLAEARETGIPLVASVHTSDPAALSDSVRAADLVFCASRAVAEAVRTRGVPKSRIRILPNRVDRTRFSPDPTDPETAALRARFPWRHGILHVGRRSREKNLEVVIATLARLGSDFGLLSVGPGEVGPYHAQAERLGVAERCGFLGPLPNAQLPSYYRWCACMCVPSLYEGFGIVFIEAMACGATVVTSAIAPMTEYIRHGVNGILVEAFEDPGAIAAAIARACEDPELHTLGTAARESTRPFAVEAVDALEVGFYREALALRPAVVRRPEAPPWWARLWGALPW